MNEKKPQRVVVRAPAKLNLALAVTGTTANGYHSVDMLLQAVDVWETVEVVRSMGYSLRLPKSHVPAGEHNTATKAAAAFFAETGLLAGADIIIHKQVPTRAGLAGGSADAAAVLVGLNALYGARLSLEELCAIGIRVGADVPFSLLGGTARAGGIGEVLQPLWPLEGCWFTILMPGAGVSTPLAYARFDKLGSPLCPNISAACSAAEKSDLAALAQHMQNMLEHASGDDTTKKLRGILCAAGALAAMMTGSGAAVFGLFKEKAQAEHAAQMAAHMVSRAFVAAPVPFGPHIIEIEN